MFSFVSLKDIFKLHNLKRLHTIALLKSSYHQLIPNKTISNRLFYLTSSGTGSSRNKLTSPKSRSLCCTKYFSHPIRTSLCQIVCSSYLKHKVVGLLDRSRTSMTSEALLGEKMDRLIWVDLEMTGLHVNKDYIIEIACIVTDGELNIIEKGPNIVIQCPEKALDSMDEWCTTHHGQSGLTAAVRASDISVEQAETEVLNFVRKHTVAGQCPLAGNSVHADKIFLLQYMPALCRHLHYRIVDVSTIKELCRRWYPEEFKKVPKKKMNHRALDDIEESIAELAYYRTHVFV